MRSSGTQAIAYRRLKQSPGIPTGHNRVYDIIQQLAEPEKFYRRTPGNAKPVGAAVVSIIPNSVAPRRSATAVAIATRSFFRLRDMLIDQFIASFDEPPQQKN